MLCSQEIMKTKSDQFGLLSWTPQDPRKSWDFFPVLIFLLTAATEHIKTPNKRSSLTNSMTNAKTEAP